MLANAREESTALAEARGPEQFEQIERFAEVAASYAQAPEQAFEDAVGQAPPMDIPGMQKLANRFKMTPLAAATRLRESGRISWDQYNSWRASWSQFVGDIPVSSGFATPVSKTIGRGGRMFSQLVFEALDANRLTMVEAARALTLRTDHFDTLRHRLVSGSAAEASDE